MQQRKFGDIEVRLTGGADREGGGDGPLVVLMHGFGAPGTDLVGLWRVLDVPRDVRFAFPEAPNEIPGMPGARAWWMLDLQRVEAAMAEGPRTYANEIPEGMEKATDQLVDMLNVAPQGLVVLSGTPVSLSTWVAGMPKREGLRVLQSHGERDPLLSFDAAQELRAAMKGAGLQVEWIPFRGGHEIPMPVLDGLGRFINDVVSEEG
jgi:phospholipase/carboxylesterase